MTPLIVAAFFALYVLWGSTYLAMHILVNNGFPPFLTAGLRMAAAGGLMWVWLAARGHARVERRDWPHLLASGALLFVGGNALTMVASRLVPSGLLAMLGATTPFWLAAGGTLFNREKISLPGAAGIIALVLLVSEAPSGKD